MRKPFKRSTPPDSRLRRLPWMKILIAAEIGMRLQSHVSRLTASERSELLAALRRPRSLSQGDRRRVKKLVKKMDLGSFWSETGSRFKKSWPR